MTDIAVANASPGVTLTWPADTDLVAKSWQVLLVDQHVVQSVTPVLSTTTPKFNTVTLTSVDPTESHTFTVQYVDSDGVLH